MPHTAVTPAIIIASKKVGDAKTPPEPVLRVQIPDDMTKVKDYSGSKFLKTKQVAMSKGNAPFDEIIAGAKVPLAIPNLFGATIFGMDPAKKGPISQADADKKKASISFDLAACGDFGRALEILEGEFLAQVKEPAVLKRLWTDPDKKPQFPCCMKRVYGKKSKEERRGKARESPVVELKLACGKFPDSFGERAGQPRTTVYNWATRLIDSKGVETFEEMRDETGAGFSLANFEKIVRPGDIVRRIHLIIEGVSIYNDGISLRLSVYRIWIERPTSSGNLLDDDEAAPSTTTTTTTVVAQAKPKPEPSPEVQAAAAAPKGKKPIVDEADEADEGEGDEYALGDDEEEDEKGMH